MEDRKERKEKEEQKDRKNKRNLLRIWVWEDLGFLFEDFLKQIQNLLLLKWFDPFTEEDVQWFLMFYTPSYHEPFSCMGS